MRPSCLPLNASRTDLSWGSSGASALRGRASLFEVPSAALRLSHLLAPPPRRRHGQQWAFGRRHWDLLLPLWMSADRGGGRRKSLKAETPRTMRPEAPRP